MRFDLRLHGKTETGKDCFMDMSVYAASKAQFEEETHKLAADGPWFYKADSEAVPESEKIMVENVEALQKGKE